MRITVTFLVLIPVMISGCVANGQDGFKWWVTPATVKIRPDDHPPAVLLHEATISAGRNEFESFQIVLRSDQNLSGFDVEVSDLKDDSGNVIPVSAGAVNLVATIGVKRPSRKQGRIGDWPDPLIPRVDSYFYEKRNAFPFSLAPGRNQAVWIDIYVPASAPPGSYSGLARVTRNGKAFTEVPIQLKVWNFTLPSTSSFPTSFGFSGVNALRQHRGQYTSDDDLRAITALYTKAALLDRISLHGGTLIPPPVTFSDTKAVIDWKEYDKDSGPFLDGMALGKSDSLAGAKATSIDLRTHNAADTDLKKLLYWREWAKHFRERGWLDRLFYYVEDEPPVTDFPKVLSLAQLAHQADSSIRTLVTLQRTASMAGAIDIWAPLINCFELKAGFDSFCRETVARATYDPDIRSGRRLWWYQSCGSHGCNVEGGEYFKGWPSYMVDDSAVSNRVMPWMAWKYRIEGELYFSTNDAFSRTVDPWTDVYLYGGNGDGTLFYPGRPDKVGGKKDIPIDSIRLKLIREGLEDYEYLVLLARLSSPETADKFVGRIVHNTYSFEADPDNLHRVRSEIGSEIDRLSRR